MTYKIKGRTWWGKNPKNNWTARNKLHSSLKRMGIGVYDMDEYRVVQIDDRVEVYKNGELVGECESYELDFICRWLGVEYEEEEI